MNVKELRDILALMDDETLVASSLPALKVVFVEGNRQRVFTFEKVSFSDKVCHLDLWLGVREANS